MRKIVFVIEQLSSGGAERVTAELANYLSKNKIYNVHIITYSKELKGEYKLEDNIVRHTIALTGNRFEQLMGRVKKLRSTIKEISPICVVSLAATKTCALLSIAMLKTGIPLIISERNDPLRYKKNIIMRIIRRLSFGISTGIVFQTKTAQSYYSEKIQRKSNVIHNPINSNLPDTYCGIREYKIVNFCRFVPQKNLDLLIDAFKGVIDYYPKYELHIYGDGPEKERIEKRIQNEQLTEKVFLHNHSSNIYNEIKSSALFVSSSNYEGISNSMLEALALGIPTICTDCPAGGAREMITNGLNGLLVPTNNIQELTNAIVKVLGDKDFAEKLSDSSIEIRKRISIDLIASEWLNYIEKCVKGVEDNDI